MFSRSSSESFFSNQIFPLSIALAVLAGGIGLLAGTISLLNLVLPGHEVIQLHIHLTDVVIGLTIYLKTSIDFAMFIGRLMTKFPGWRNRIQIEAGTALGNIVGTLAVLIIWSLFREVHLLMAAMILLAALVLFRLAEEGLEHVRDAQPGILTNLAAFLERFLHTINQTVAPVLDRLVPKLDITTNNQTRRLLYMAFTVPFILGLDDFAGYLPLFNVVNVFGFAIGVFAGHTILNAALFLSPQKTTAVVKNRFISLLGSIAFIGLAVWGAWEALHFL